MIVYPAIDLRHGRCVRLRQGEMAAETVFAADPVQAALRWAKEGASWLHVVNLDGAIGDASEDNLDALSRILAAVDLPVQFGGGIRSAKDALTLLDQGVTRVILGTVAITHPEVVASLVAARGPVAVCVGIDARDGLVATHGWLETTSVPAATLAAQMREMGVSRMIHTDISRDGMLNGVNVAASRQLAQEAEVGVIASGGVSGIEDIRAVAQAEADGVEGVIVGMALYKGTLSLGEALAISA